MSMWGVIELPSSIASDEMSLGREARNEARREARIRCDTRIAPAIRLPREDRNTVPSGEEPSVPIELPGMSLAFLRPSGGTVRLIRFAREVAPVCEALDSDCFALRPKGIEVAPTS